MSTKFAVKVMDAIEIVFPGEYTEYVERELTLIDRKTGQDWSADFIGNSAHGMKTDDEGRYVTDAQGYSWWADMIASWEAMEDAIEAAEREHGREKVHQWLMDMGAYDWDLADQPEKVKEILAEIK